MRGLTIMALAGATLASGASAQTPPINCTISPAQTIELSAAVPGVVAEVAVSRGGHVAAGDIIVRLDDDLARVDARLAEQQAAFDGAIRAAEAQLASLEDRRERLQQAVDLRAIPQGEFQELLLEITLAEIAVQQEIQDRTILSLQSEQADQLLEELTVRSPIDAIVGEDLISVGESAATRPVATLYAVGSVRIEAFVPVPFLDRVLEAAQVSVAEPGSAESHAVELDYVAPAANLSSNTIAVYFTMEGDAMRPGSSCRLVF